MWYRVFCRSLAELKPALLLEYLETQHVESRSQFRGDDLGWTGAEIVVGSGTPVYLERYLTATDNLREDLNTWAGYLETLDYSPNNTLLMEHMIQTQQLLTLRKPIDHPNEVALEKACDAMCSYFATHLDGVYQIEGDGWYASDGKLLIKEY